MLAAHPSAGVLSDYASGALPTAPGVVVAAHLELCACCRATVATFEEVGGALLSEAPMDRMGLAALGRALKGIEGAAFHATPVAGGAPRSVTEVGVGTRRRLGPGRWVSPVRASRRRDWRVFLLRTSASAQRRDWPAEAFVCVLAGALRSGGAVYRAGDFGEVARGGLHRSVVLPGGPLVALVAMRRPRGDKATCRSVG